MSKPITATDGKTVWVNDATGMCIGRFSRFGIDVHRAFEEQIAGLGQCLHCTHARPGLIEWHGFVEAMRERHGVAIPASCLPEFLR